MRRRIVEICAAAARDWARSPDAVGSALRAARELSAAERRFVGEAVHELIRYRLQLGLIAGSDEPAALLDAWLAARENPATSTARLAEVVGEEQRAALRVSFPPWLFERFVAAFGLPDAEAVARSMNRRAPLCVRANRLRGSREALAGRLATLGYATSPTPLAPDGLIFEGHPNVHALAPFQDGSMEIQDEGSQLLALMAEPGGGDLTAATATVGEGRGALQVVDACAGAGGKTLAIGARLGDRGRVVALDVGRQKLLELERRAGRAGLEGVRTVVVEDGVLPEGIAPSAVVLVDAPCSGVGVLRRNPETRHRLSPEELDALPARQLGLLSLYSSLVAPGGRLVYGTCSVLPEENERVVEAFLAAHPRFSLIALSSLWGVEAARGVGDGVYLQLRPDLHDTDGFFGAVLAAASSTTPAAPPP